MDSRRPTTRRSLRASALRGVPGTSGKTSIRAGWGLFYNPIEQLVLEQFSAEPPFGGSTFPVDTLFNTPFLAQSGSVSIRIRSMEF